MNARKGFAVIKRSVDAVLAQLPRVTALTPPARAFDAFIGAAGFEERVLGIPRALAAARQHVRGPILLGRYDTNLEDNARRQEELLPLLSSLGAAPQFLRADHPEDVRRVIHERFAEVASVEPLHVAFDISGASSTLIFSVMAALCDMEVPVSVTILYASATKYHDPGEDAHQKPVGQWEDGSLREVGVRDVDTNELYRGMHHDHLPGFVIAFPSMYAARLQRCLSHLGVGPLSGATDSVFWVLPRTDEDAHRWRQESIMRAVQDLLDNGDKALPPENHTYCDIWDYQYCLRLVLDLVDRQEGANTSVIHMGTKVQAIGIALALLARPEVSLINARPTSFSAHSYSVGIGSCYQIQIGNLKDVVKSLRDVGMIDIVSKA